MSSGALAGVRVLDLTRYIPGPYATMMLADFGADVVKVEPRDGDPVRAIPPAVGGEGAAHAALNRGKRSIALDLRTEEGAAVVRRLAARSDVLVEAFRPGVLDRRGLGAEAMAEVNPRLVYCSVAGYGREGAYADRAAHDVDALALGGFLAGNRGGDGRPVLPPAQVADMSTALLAVIGILAALHARERTGRGQRVDVSLLRATASLMALPLSRSLAGGAGGELSGGFACYSAYRCRDGRFLAVGALEPLFWERLCRALGRPDLIALQWAHGERQGTAKGALDALFATRDRDDWVRDLASADACVEPVLELDEVAAHPALEGATWRQPVGDGGMRTVAPPVGLSSAPVGAARSAPALGAHTDALLEETGYTRDDVRRLRAAGIVS